MLDKLINYAFPSKTFETGKAPVQADRGSFIDLLKSLFQKPEILSPLADLSATQAQQQAQQPAPMPVPTAQPEVLGAQTPYQHKIPIQTPQGDGFMPANLAQLLMENFDDIKEATNAARMLTHPTSQTYTPEEIAKLGRESWNNGENPNFELSAEMPNPDGTVDRGLMRNNSFTFEDMLQNAYWRNRMRSKGINAYEDMDDPNKSMAMARLTLERGNWDSEKQRIRPNPSWLQWYAAPLDLRMR
jgi:hypothetical protein